MNSKYQLENKTFHLSHGLTLQVTQKVKLLCFNPNDNDRAAREMWRVHTDDRLREILSLRLVTPHVDVTD